MGHSCSHDLCFCSLRRDGHLEELSGCVREQDPERPKDQRQPLMNSRVYAYGSRKWVPLLLTESGKDGFDSLPVALLGPQ